MYVIEGGMRVLRVKFFTFLIVFLFVVIGVCSCFLDTTSFYSSGVEASEPLTAGSGTENGQSHRAWTSWAQTTSMDFSNGSITDLVQEGTPDDAQLRLKRDGQWLNQNPANKPSPRQTHGMATIFGDDKVMLFGGIGGSLNSLNNETWLYDLSDNQWYQKNPTLKPSSRVCYSMCAINNSDEVILYGGEGYVSTKTVYYRDTWKYNVTTNQWTNMTPNDTPNAENGQSMATVYNTDKIVLFGGFYPYGSCGGDETWIYDLSENTWEQKFSAVTPPVRSRAGMAPIYNTDLVLMFGGYDGQSGSRRDTWLYNITSNTWTQQTPGVRPSSLNNPAFASIYGDDKVLLFGGNELTWVYDLSEGTWTQMLTSKKPSGVARMANVFGTSKTIHFGAQYPPSDDETWLYDPDMYEPTGEFISSEHDCGDESNFKTLSWGTTTPMGTTIRFQVRTGSTSAELEVKPFVGPNGGTNEYYTNSGTQLWSGHEKDRWFQLKAYFNTTDFYQTPILHNFMITYNVIPELLNDKYEPTKGDITTKFNFTVTYKDHDNDAPAFVRVCIDKSNHTMFESHNIPDDYTIGRKFWYTTLLSVGEHTYQFFASDGDGTCQTVQLPINVNKGPLDHIMVSPTDAVITTDEHQQFTAVGYDRDNNIVELNPSWEVSGGGSIDSIGNFTARTVGTWKVIARSKGISGNTTIIVTGGKLASILVTPDQKMITTDDYQLFTAEGFDADHNKLAISPSWDVTGGGDIDPNGNFTARYPGVWTVFANSSGISGNANIEVTSGKLFKIKVVPQNATITTEEFIILSATGYDADMNVITIQPIWSVSGGGKIDQDGNFTSSTPGSFIIFANISNITANAEINVIPGKITSILISPLYSEINISESVTFTAKFYDEFNNEVEYSSPIWNINGGGTIDESGKFVGTQAGLWIVSCNISGSSELGETAQVRVFPVEDNGPDDIDNGKEDDDKSGSDMVLFAGVGVLVIVIIVIVLLILLLMLKKKQRQKLEP